MLSELHQILLSCGYRYVDAKQIVDKSPLLALCKSKGFYIKNYQTEGGSFEIALSLEGDPYIELPSAHVLQCPQQYLGLLLPHINMGWYLCYVEEMEADWDSNDLHATYLAVDHQIHLTLQNSIASIAEGKLEDREMEGEFSAYWLGDKSIYLLTDAIKARSERCVIAVKKDSQSKPGEKQYQEWIIFDPDNEHEGNNWLSQRDLNVNDEMDFVVGHFKIKPKRLCGVQWPPKNFAEIISWLSNVDPAARNHIIDHFARNREKRHVLLLEVYRQDIVGLSVELNLNATGLTTYVKKRKVKHNNLASILSSKLAVNKFIRLSVIKADRKTVLSRNRSRPEVGDLSNKKIALIGCGTVGGYLAGLLVRAGAGCGTGHLHLYDPDRFHAHNFSRHPLTTADYGKNKSKALADSLISATHLANNEKILGNPIHFPITSHIDKYDIVIDTTGRPPLSKRLSKTVRMIGVKKRPLIIHGFNDGNGRASKVLVDNGNGCYGCMLADPAFYKEGIDLRFQDIDQKAERLISCGSTYTPYDAAVSVITASLLQEAVLNSLEKENSWTYSEHMLDGNRSRKPYRMPRHAKCEICND